MLPGDILRFFLPNGKMSNVVLIQAYSIIIYSFVNLYYSTDLYTMGWQLPF